MDNMTINSILSSLGFPGVPDRVTPFCAEEDGKPYNVWKLESAGKAAVLKLVSREELEIYNAFFPGGGGPVPEVYASGEYGGRLYMLMEYIDGRSLSRCTRENLVPALDALISTQERFWGDTRHAGIGYCFDECYPDREKRLSYMGGLSAAYEAYLEAFRTVPRTLCNDDMLPFNVLSDGKRAVILDWEYAGILPYPCALARFLAFGEEDGGELFQMSPSDKEFALNYYYDRLICEKGIAREDYDRTMKLFFFKEYSEWVYCANQSGEPGPEYEKYFEKSKLLASEPGFIGAQAPSPAP